MFLIIPPSSYSVDPKLTGSVLSDTAKHLVSVAMGRSITTEKPNEILRTEDLTYCSALALLSKKNDAGDYQSRTLMHILGGNIDPRANSFDTSNIIKQFISNLSDGDVPKIIFIGGRDSQENRQLARTIGQSIQGESKPILEILKRKNASICLGGSISIELKPNGEFNLSAHTLDRGLLTPNETSAILESATEI